MDFEIVFVVPVYNEEKILEGSITQLYDFMSENIEDSWIIVVANNGSTDNTLDIANKISQKLDNVKVVDIKRKGRGQALKIVWGSYDAKIYCYCDVDLSTDLVHIAELIEAVKSGTDVVTGSRYLDTSKTNRTIHRLILSRGYNLLVGLFFNSCVSDYQCGFKAVSARIVCEILSKIQDDNWFFDTELLLTASKHNYKIEEIPISWNENKQSKVNIVKTVYEYIMDLWMLKRRLK